MKYYAFEYESARNTTTGTPNKTTGCYSIAGCLTVFTSKKARDQWVDDGKVTRDMQGNCRVALSAKEARGHRLGKSEDDYKEYLDFILDVQTIYNELVDI